jgi:hypothetical protein
MAAFQQHCRTAVGYAIADLIRDLGHLAEVRSFDFVSEVRRRIKHWFAEGHAEDRTTISGRML